MNGPLLGTLGEYTVRPMDPMRFGASGHATIRAKICSCSIALASLVSSSWHKKSSNRLSARSRWRTRGTATYNNVNIHERNVCTNKQTSKQTNKQRKNQNCWLYRSYHLTYLISWNQFFPVYVHESCFNHLQPMGFPLSSVAPCNWLFNGKQPNYSGKILWKYEFS